MKIGLIKIKSAYSNWYISYIVYTAYENFLVYHSLNDKLSLKEDIKIRYREDGQKNLEKELSAAKKDGSISDFIILEKDNEIELFEELEKFMLLMEII